MRLPYIKGHLIHKLNFFALGPVIANFNIKEGGIILYINTGCFALLIDAKHLNTEYFLFLVIQHIVCIKR